MSFPRRGVATLLQCWLALQRPPDKNQARGTLPKDSKAHTSFCAGLFLLITEIARRCGRQTHITKACEEGLGTQAGPLANTLTSREVTIGTGPSQLNCWPRARNPSAKGLGWRRVKHCSRRRGSGLEVVGGIPGTTSNSVSGRLTGMPCGHIRGPWEGPDLARKSRAVVVNRADERKNAWVGVPKGWKQQALGRDFPSPLVTGG